MANIGSASLLLSADTKRLETDLSKAQSKFKEFSNGIGQIGAAVRLGQGFTLGFSSLPVASIVQYAKSLANLADQTEELSHLNDLLGTQFEWLTKLQTVAMETGVSQEKFTSGLNRLNQFLGAAAMGGEEQIATLQRLGLDYRQIRDGNFQDNFLRIADAFGRITDTATKAKLAAEMFGREGGGNFLRLISRGREELEAMIAQASGATEEDRQRIIAMNDGIDRITTAWRNMGLTILRHVAPAIEAITNGITRLPGLIQQATRGWMAFLGIEDPQIAARRAESLRLIRLRREFVEAGNTWAEAMRQLPNPGQAAPAPAGGPQLLDAGGAAIGPFRDQVAVVHNALNAQIREYGLSTQQLQIHRLELAAANDAQRRLLITTRELAAQREGLDVTRANRLPQEVLNDELQRLNRIFRAGGITQETLQRGSVRAFQQFARETALNQQQRFSGAQIAGSSEAASTILRFRAGPVNQDMRGLLQQQRDIQQRQLAELQRIARDLQIEGPAIP